MKSDRPCVFVRLQIVSGDTATQTPQLPKPQIMKTIIRNLVLCSTLFAPVWAQAALVLFPDGGFDSGKGTWGEAGPAIFSYPVSDGNPGGYGAMNANGAWGVLVSSNNDGSFIPLASLGLVAGNGYNFQMDMRIEAGSNTNNLGELKLEWDSGGDTGDMPATYIDANWNTHIFPYIIPAAATGLKVVPVANDDNHVGFDNIGFDDVPYYVAPPPPPPPSDLTLSEPFDDVSSEANWSLPAPPGTITTSLDWINTDGNPAGSTEITVANPDGNPSEVIFTYTATGVDFGTGPLEISFDGKFPEVLVATAIHVRINGNFFGAVQGSFNPTTFTTYTQSFELTEGFESTDTFTLQFSFAMGAVPGGGGTIIIDNIEILTNLGGGDPEKVETSIDLGTMVSWTPTDSNNFYQAQESDDGITYVDLGPEILGTAVNAVFDPEPSAFYQVVESVPATEEAVHNGGFETLVTGDPEGWQLGGNQPPAVIATDANTGTNSMRFTPAATVADPLIPTYDAAVSVLEQNTNNAGGPAITPGGIYDFSFWFKLVSAGPGYVQHYKVDFLDDVGGILSSTGVQGFSGAVGVWEQFTVNDLTAPAGAVSAKILIQGITGALEGSAGELIVDDVSLLTSAPGSSSVIAATTASAAEISWLSANGVDYQPRKSTTDLDVGSWSDLGGPITGDGSVKAFYDSPLGDTQFYRVEY
jgi:hypothetical protein